MSARSRLFALLLTASSCTGTDGVVFQSRDMAVPILPWAKQGGGKGFDHGINLVVMPDGGAVVVGFFETTATFGRGEPHETTLVSDGRADILIARYAATGELVWARRAGGMGDDRAWGVARTADGGVAVAGSFEQMATFGAGEAGETLLTTRGVHDVFVASFTDGGALKWVRQAGGSLEDYGESIAVTPDGDVIVTGAFSGQGVFGANQKILNAQGSEALFVVIYSSSGEFQDAQQAGGSGSSYAEAVTALVDGGWAITGSFSGPVLFGPGQANETAVTSAVGKDIFVARYDRSGYLQWASPAGGTWPAETGEAIVGLPDGGLIVSGEFGETAIFGSDGSQVSLTSAGNLDVFVARYSSAGKLVWARGAGGPDGDEGNGLAVTADGDIFATGHFSSAATFGLGEGQQTVLMSAGEFDIFLAKLDSVGALKVAMRAGGAARDRGMSIASTGNGVLMTGVLTDSGTFFYGEPFERALITPAASSDLFVARFP